VILARQDVKPPEVFLRGNAADNSPNLLPTTDKPCRMVCFGSRAVQLFRNYGIGTHHAAKKENATVRKAVAFMVAGGGFEPPTFGLCDLTHLSMRVGLYLHPRGVPAIQSLRLPPKFRGLGSVLPYRSRDLGSTDFDE